MKKQFAVFLSLALAFAFTAYAGSLVSSGVQIATQARPNTPTDGVLLAGPTGEPIKGVVVSITDYNDGGADEDYYSVLAAKAWVYRPQDKMPDGGGGWSRWPLGDVSTTYTAGDVAFGSVTASRGATVTLPSVAVAGTFPSFGNGTRLFYQTFTTTNIDAGSTQAVRVTIEAKY